MKRLSTHRVIQLSILLDNLQALARVHARCVNNLSRIGNQKGASHYRARAVRENSLIKCISQRLQAA